PLAYLITWTTYGTWLPGDERGWIQTGKGVQPPDSRRQEEAIALMTEDACVLTTEQRGLVERTVADHCRIRRWELHIVNCRTNHVHVIVSADREKEGVREQFKARCTRRLKAFDLERRQRGAPEPGPVRLQCGTGRGRNRCLN